MSRRIWTGLWALLLLPGCHLIFPFSEAERTNGNAPGEVWAAAVDLDVQTTDRDLTISEPCDGYPAGPTCPDVDYAFSYCCIYFFGFIPI